MDSWTAAATREIKVALVAKDQHALNLVMVNLALEGHDSAEVQALAEMLLSEQPHAVQEWWNGTCNCDGHQN